ncbi:MAG: GYD domain-containing protein [bacterium]
MGSFLMLGRYSQDAINGIASQRTKEAVKIIEKAGGKVKLMYSLLGGYDLALLVELGSVTETMKVSVSLAKLTGISFRSFPAITVEEFDKSMEK